MKLPKRSELKTESPIEELLVNELCRLGFCPTTQLKIGRYRVDIAFPEKMIVVECDGKEWHSSDEQIEYDRQRDAYLKSLGWKVIRVTGGDIYKHSASIAEAVGYGNKPRLPKRSNFIPIDFENDDWLTIQDKMEENKIMAYENEAEQKDFIGVQDLLSKKFKDIVWK